MSHMSADCHCHYIIGAALRRRRCGQRWQLLHRHPLQFGGRIFLALGAAHWQQQHAQQMIAASRSSQREQEARCVVGFGVRCNLYLKRVDSPPPAPRTPPAVTPLAPAPRLTTSHQPTQACRLSLVGRREVVGCRLSVVAATGRRTSVVGCKSQRGADTFRQNGCTTYNVHTRFVGCGSILADATYNVQPTNKNGRKTVEILSVVR